MPSPTSDRSFLFKMRVCNLGCIGPSGVDVLLDEIVCLVGANNTGKSTVLRAYEAAVTGAPLTADDVSTHGKGVSPTVELWVHIPKDAGNVDAKWKENVEGMLLVRSKWTWPPEGGKPVRATWDPTVQAYADEGKAAGLDTVFNSRLPRPFRIGSLEDPEEEHKRLLDLVLEPIKLQLAALMRDEASDLFGRAAALKTAAEVPVEAFRERLDRVQSRVNDSYRSVFGNSRVQLSVSLGDLPFDPGAALTKASHIGIIEPYGASRWDRQGTGSQRALFWSMLEVRSELHRAAEELKVAEKNRKKRQDDLTKAQAKLAKATKPAEKTRLEEDVAAIQTELAAMAAAAAGSPQDAPAPFLPGFMLLIDEPETALHPGAIRAAKDYLYSLAAEAGWQVMLSTHHPAFIDPLKDHTTIVRLHRPDQQRPPNTYRSDSAGFTGEEREQLKALMAFDQSVSEIFFSRTVVIVEGDTEYAAFMAVMNSEPALFPTESRPLILRARGKWTIPLLLRMVSHFKVACSVLHDVDAPRTSGGAKRNSAYSANRAIADTVSRIRAAGTPTIHRCSVPEFERGHGMELPPKDKPYEAWKAVANKPPIRDSIRSVLLALCEVPTPDAPLLPEDGGNFEDRLKAWALAHAPQDPAYSFEP